MIEVEIEADAWTDALPQAEGIVERAAVAARPACLAASVS